MIVTPEDRAGEVQPRPFVDELRALGLAWSPLLVDEALRALTRLEPSDARTPARARAALRLFADLVARGAMPDAPAAATRLRAERIDTDPLGQAAREAARRALPQQHQQPARIDRDAELLLNDPTWRREQYAAPPAPAARRVAPPAFSHPDTHKPLAPGPSRQHPGPGARTNRTERTTR